MNFLKTINGLRSALMHRITKNIGISHHHRNVDLTGKVEIKKVLICRPNHRLGNLLLITPLVQEVIATFPHCKIDLFVKGNATPIIFKNYGNINEIIQLPKKPLKQLTKYIQGWITIKKNYYDIAINVVKSSSSGRLSAQFANAKYKFFGDEIEDIQSEFKDHEHMAKYPIYNLRNYLSKLGYTKSDKPIALLDLKLSPSEVAEGRAILSNLVSDEKKTICLFTYATGAKCYSDSWWGTFYERLIVEFPNHNIIEVLPIENISMISFKVPSFYSKDIRQIGSLIANTEVFIGADSGMMHLASSVQIPTVGLFSVVNPNIYQPYNHNSVGINTSDTGIDECFKVLNRIIIDN